MKVKKKKGIKLILKKSKYEVTPQSDWAEGFLN